MSKKEAMRTGMMALLQRVPSTEEARTHGTSEQPLETYSVELPASGHEEEASSVPPSPPRPPEQPATDVRRTPQRTGSTRPERKPRPVHEQQPVPSTAGTIERPVYRQRDGRETRKIGVVLPVDLLVRLDTCCAQPPKMKVNVFIERAIEEALKQSRE